MTSTPSRQMAKPLGYSLSFRIANGAATLFADLRLLEFRLRLLPLLHWRIRILVLHDRRPVVSVLLHKPLELFLHLIDGRGISRVLIDALQLVRVFFEIEQLPGVDVVEVD